MLGHGILGMGPKQTWNNSFARLRLWSTGKPLAAFATTLRSRLVLSNFANPRLSFMCCHATCKKVQEGAVGSHVDNSTRRIQQPRNIISAAECCKSVIQHIWLTCLAILAMDFKNFVKHDGLTRAYTNHVDKMLCA